MPELELPESSLDSVQRQAVSAQGHCLVMACPGAGKTRMLSQRAVKLMRSLPDAALAAVTFTRDAALEIRSRILALQGGKPPPGSLLCGTFHSLALHQLRSDGLNRKVLSGPQQMAAIRDAIRLAGVDMSLENAIKAIEARGCTLDPDTSGQSPGARVFAAYRRILDRIHGMDFSDLIREAVRGMRQGRVAPLPVDFLLVDEFQDTDPVQYTWIMEHARAGVEVTVVGDDDQSIYGWRRAMGAHGVSRFKADFSPEAIVMANNYRSAAAIVSTAGRLIEHNCNRVPKPFKAASLEEGKVEARRFLSREEEAWQIACEMAASREDWGILARTNNLLDAYEQALAQHQIPYTRAGGPSFWESPGPSLLIGFLASVAEGTLPGIFQAAEAAGVSRKMLAHLPTPSGAALYRALASQGENAVLAEMGRLMGVWHGHAREGRTTMAVLGATEWLAGHTQGLSGPIMKAGEIISRMKKGTLASRLAYLSRQKSRKNAGVRVRLMTLHAAKGLEFSSVWIPAVEEDVLPHKNGEIEEERRLCYVGMTRAKRRLVVSCSIGSGTPSRFFSEAGLRF